MPKLLSREEIINEIQFIENHVKRIRSEVDSFNDIHANKAYQLLGTASLALNEAKSWLKD